MMAIRIPASPAPTVCSPQVINQKGRQFPVMAMALDVEATGTRLGKDKVVAAGAAVMCVESPDSDVETLATTKVKFQVDYPGDFEPRCLAQFWDAPPTNRRAANDELRHESSRFWRQQRPFSRKRGMLEPPPAK